jgi:hypothetical protein
MQTYFSRRLSIDLCTQSTYFTQDTLELPNCQRSEIHGQREEKDRGLSLEFDTWRMPDAIPLRPLFSTFKCEDF